jgi:hypothetical protein
MSLVETPTSAMNTGTVKWAGVALAVVGGAAALGAGWLSGSSAELAALASLLTLAALLGLIVWVPNAFVTTSVRGSSGPVADFAFIVPPILLLVGGSGLHLLRLEGLELAAAAMAGLAVVGMIWAPRPEPTMTPTSHIILAGAFAAGLGWGGATLINCLFDASPGQTYQASVQQKYQTNGRGSHYDLVLAPFGPVEHPGTVSVNYATYASTEEGASICASVRPGALGFLWWRVGC